MSDTTTFEIRPQRADARRNRERILTAARVVFGQSGADAQIDDVAAAAGVGVGTVYRHFPTKEVLLTELVREKFRALIKLAREAGQTPGRAFDVTSELLHAMAAQLADDAALQQTLAGIDPEPWNAAAAEQAELVASTDELLARGREDGSLRDDLTGSDVGMLMCGLCATMSHEAPGFDPERHLELIIDVLRPRTL